MIKNLDIRAVVDEKIVSVTAYCHRENDQLDSDNNSSDLDLGVENNRHSSCFDKEANYLIDESTRLFTEISKMLVL